MDERFLKELIEPARTEWAAPKKSAPKKHNYRHSGVNYKYVNAKTKQDVYKVPRMDEYINFFWEVGVTCTLDSNSGYWHVKQKQKSRQDRFCDTPRTLSICADATWIIICSMYIPRNNQYDPFSG